VAHQPEETSSAASRTIILTAAWVGTLAASWLPGIIWQELFGGDATSVLWVRVGSVMVLLVLSLVWKAIAPLTGYLLVLLALMMGEFVLRPLIEFSRLWQQFFGAGCGSWFMSSLGPQLLRLLMALLPWVVLVSIGLKRSDYFLVRGRLDAPAEPVRWLGMREPLSWTRFGTQSLVILAALFLVLSLLTNRPSTADLVRALPLLPVALLFAAMNSFNENFAYRASLLSQLLPAVGKQQGLLLTVVLFALGHFYGMPPGVLGLLLFGLLGWLLAKSMLETKGFLWAWLIQFALDVLVFTFWAVGVVTTSGG